MSNLLFDTDIISMRDLSLDKINAVLKLAKQFKSKAPKKYLLDKIIAHCFFESSTRTRLSFEAASLRLGAQVIGFSNAENLSVTKGENLSDTIKTISKYADLIVLRHPQAGSASLAAEITDKPVINAGDGANQHPTQALADLMTIEETQGKLEGLSIALVGDLKYGRTIHSLIQACALFHCHLFLVAPPLLALPESFCDELHRQDIPFSLHANLDEVISKVDIIYMTRLQQERFNKDEHKLLENQFVLKAEKLKNAKPGLKVLHPLPRAGEIDKAIDKTPYAAYFEQVENAVYIRQALLTLVLNKNIN
ncbi:aspartate carbamoyltransferase [Candidatus Rickettsiella viridis]|uniref:Aspartate carbamoyltransferase n=1 Tax=Candidatus Rickettsiella viridis TaxID=676208 RepID=A0A2Z5USZ7_9COXI|nr:aspartate carbamoyltransferase [Candidatus Rickettsiella viridis]BBB14706.1 aspartate carbamoyltransferase [Candidatus Rickettsiella viridis]